MVLALLVLVAGVISTWLLAPAANAGTARRRPSIVFFLTDDQRWDTLWAMPHVRRLLADHGVVFQDAFVVDSLCCPSRASILTGDYAHTTGVYTNSGFRRFRDRTTIATALHGLGYHTGLFGKYLNGYFGTTYVPPGWSRWFAFEGSNEGGNYYNYTVNDNGIFRFYGDRPGDYSTTVLTRQAVDFVKTTSGPLFLYWAPSAPHRPAVPGPNDLDAFDKLRPYRPPNYNEADVSDKPEWVQRLPRWDLRREAAMDAVRKNQFRTLLSVDRGVARIVRALRHTGRLHRTMFVFMSDNGLAWGEHRWAYKIAPYEESIRVPLVIRYDQIVPRARKDSHLALNLDLAPTWARIAGATLPPTDGRSLVRILRGRRTRWRRTFLVENGTAPRHHGVPKFCAVRSYRYLYVGYGTGEEELYALRRDPYELLNVASARDMRPVRRHFRKRLRELCQPPPPGYVIRH